LSCLPHEQRDATATARLQIRAALEWRRLRFRSGDGADSFVSPLCVLKRHSRSRTLLSPTRLWCTGTAPCTARCSPDRSCLRTSNCRRSPTCPAR
jgi:hypothetical protein